MTRLGAVRLYGGVAPGSEAWSHDERRYYSAIFGTEVVTNVVVPTLTPVLPERPNGTGVIVAPGGGYHALSINPEGFDVARWLAARGVVAFVLKYRLVPTGQDGVAELIRKLADDLDGGLKDMERIAPLAATDGTAAVRLVRDRAAEFGIDPARIGLVGFSAGGNLAMRVVYTRDDRARPDFVAPIYASVRDYRLDDPPAGSGPLFIVAATDDQLGLAEDAIEIYNRWRCAGLGVELHLYATGKHGFGLRRQGLPSDTWIDRFGDWLGAAGLLG